MTGSLFLIGMPAVERRLITVNVLKRMEQVRVNGMHARDTIRCRLNIVQNIRICLHDHYK